MRLSYPTNKLGGATLGLHAKTTWALTTGVDPVVMPIEMDPDEIESLIRESRAVTLSLDYGARSVRFLELYVIGATPTSDTNSSALLLADRRIWWKRKHIVRRYNIRTRSGNRRRLDADGEIPEQNAAVADDVTWKRDTLRNKSQPWTAQEMVKDVLDEVAPGWSGNLAQFTQRTVDNVELDDSHDVALARVLAYLPGADVALDRDGKVYIVNRFDHEATNRMLKMAPDSVWQGGVPVFVDLANQRPSKIRGLLNVEQEVRFDSYAGSETVTKDTRFCEMVIPVPDPTLEINGRTVVQGTWVTIEEILAGWNASKGNANLPDLTIELINEHWLTGQLEAYWGELGKTNPSVVWIRRIRTLRAHYRQTYRISRYWIDKIISFQAKRVAILDFETGQRAPSYVYTDYTVMVTMRGGFARGLYQDAMQPIEGAVEPGEPLSAGESSEAVLSIVDQELGIVRVDLSEDLLDHVHTMIPGKVLGIPTLNPREWRTRPYYQDGTKNKGMRYGTRLSDSHRVSFVVTMAPGVPNSTNMLYPVEVSPQEADEYLPPGVQLGKCNGPPMDVRIGPALTTARFAWSHSKRAAIERSMGVAGSDEGTDRSEIADLQQNPDETRELVKAVAASVYAGMANRWEGLKTDAINPDLKPTGSISRVEFTVRTDGSGFSIMSMPPEVRAPDPLALMPTSVRRTLLGDVQP